MSYAELLPAVQLLPQSDKLRLLEFLSDELKMNEADQLIDEYVKNPLWSQYDAFEAAEIMKTLTDEYKFK